MPPDSLSRDELVLRHNLYLHSKNHPLFGVMECNVLVEPPTGVRAVVSSSFRLANSI